MDPLGELQLQVMQVVWRLGEATVAHVHEALSAERKIAYTTVLTTMQALEPYLAMKDAAARDGIEIRIVSSFRDFAAQQRIWDQKYLGERPLYDAHGNAREHGKLGPDELVDAIVCWSAVPGGPRWSACPISRSR